MARADSVARYAEWMQSHVGKSPELRIAIYRVIYGSRLYSASVAIAVILIALLMPLIAKAEYLPISLQRLITLTVNDHPLVRGDVLEVSASELDVTAAQRQWWPTVSAVMETDSGNVTSGPSRALQVEQTLWDGGKISAGIAHANAGLAKSEARVIWQRQQLALQVVAAWQQLIGARDKLGVAGQTMDRLRTYEAQMRRRVAADASPSIDLELVLSRIRQTEVELSSARSALRAAAQRLEQLSGVAGLDERTGDLPLWPNPETVRQSSVPVVTADLSTYARDSFAVQVAKGDAQIVAAQLDAKRAERWPTAYVRLVKPLGNSSGSFSDSQVVDNSPAVFLGVRYTPGAGFATGVQADALSARVASVDQSVEAAYREQREAMTADREDFTSSLERLRALEDAVAGAQQVLDSYSRQFTAGRKTWIDLLNAVRELSQNQFAQAESQAAMTAALYRLQLRQGRTQLLP
ncbi:TolC family protein [Pseudomonas sp. NPDC087346]|uniref:TolC family protein n=1 Tax=Pseudomonas sp. NPDC087346 TaxID=3364438 RepID=UPI0038169107